jgi:hypothetical protein
MSPTNPISRECPSRNDFAAELTRYPSSATASITRDRVSADTRDPSTSFSTMLTVAWLTPAARATSCMVGPLRRTMETPSIEGSYTYH